MSTFLRFPEITNHYQAIWIQKWLERYPELGGEAYVVMEKLHGANIQIYFEPGKALYRVGSRNRFLEPHSKFYNIWGALTRIGHLLAESRQWLDDNQKSLRLFGELHGGNVQTGVNYGSEQNIRFFAAMINDELVSTARLLSLDIPHLRKHLAPILGLKESLEAALAFNIDRPSVLTPDGHKGDNLIEGIVIQPYDRVYHNEHGTFMIKKKNPAFLVSGKKKGRIPMESAIVELRVAFQELITETRIDSIISQNGPFIEVQQLGEYIVAVLNDAKADFYLRHRDILDQKTQKYIFNAGNLIANMLKARLASAAAA